MQKSWNPSVQNNNVNSEEDNESNKITFMILIACVLRHYIFDQTKINKIIIEIINKGINADS